MTSANGTLSRVLALVFPPVCACCGNGIAPGEAPLCGACRERWDAEKRGYGSAPPVRPPEGITGAYHLAYYIPSRMDGGAVSDRMAYAMKEGWDRFVYPFLARQLCSALYMSAADGRREPEDEELKRLSDMFGVVSWLPRSEKNVLKYGVDQSRRLAREISSLTGIKAAALFVNSSKLTQHELTAGERRANMSGLVLRKDAKKELGGKRLLLTDDIVTTGASVSAAAKLALAAGAADVTLLAPFRTQSKQ